MESNWMRGLKFVLDREGGYVNDPDDPGGETNFGISKRSYPDMDIKGLTAEKAGEIYRRDFWDACNCSMLADGLDVAVFDTAVNMGVGAAKTIRANTDGFEDFIVGRIQRYLDIVKKKPTSLKFLVGWISRTLQLRAMFKGGVA